MATVDYFLKIDGIDGESTDDKHKNEIEIESFSWGLSNSGSAAHGGGAGAGKASFQDFSFVTPVTKASPKLFLACASGEHIKQAILTARKAGKGQQEFLKVTLTDLLVSSYQTDGAGGETVPTDQVSLNFSKIEVSYREQKADGSLGESSVAGWDIKANKGG
ncbi:MAG TPA: type VI secretion system tube protein Hcp [Acidimicrobiales bacterium]|nr:type VI secretion system tube protein Hcp [Acidimicrobiales bacterium]